MKVWPSTPRRFMHASRYFLLLSLLTGCASNAPPERPVEPLPTASPVRSLPSLRGFPAFETKTGAQPVVLSYAAKIGNAIRSNIVLSRDALIEDLELLNPEAEVEVRTAPSGKIVGARLLKASGVRAWDNAVLRAVQVAGSIPLDTNGQAPPVLILHFRARSTTAVRRNGSAGQGGAARSMD